MSTSDDVTLSEVDLLDELQLRAWWEVGRAAGGERAFDAWPLWEVSRVSLPLPRDDVDLTLVTATDLDGRVVGAGMLVMFLLDNTHLADLDVQVLPGDRRRGIGSRVLAWLEDRARAAGRTTLTGTAYAPVGAESPGSLFCAARGYPVANHEETKLLDLRTAPGGWDRLDREVEAGLGGYRVVGFLDRLPEEHLDAFAGLMSAFMTMIPTGDLDVERAAWTAARVHAHEQRMADTGRRWIGALALTPDGEPCGFTDLALAEADPRHAEVRGTLVLPEHRGHRLGLGMKLQTHRRLLELFPGCEHVETGNAGSNAPMNAVNEALGYRVVERCLDVQKVLVTAS